MTSERAHPNYVAVWVWLVVLMIVGVLASYLPLGRSVVVVLIFVIAAAKATLVGLYYMHLKFESRLIHAMVIIPVVLVIGLTFLLFPDFVFHH